MGEQISNNTLAVLLVAAIVISLVGTFISLSKLGKVSEAPGITGFQTAYGNVTLTLNLDTTITINPSGRAFGSGYIGNTTTYGILTTNSSGWSNYNVAGFNNLTWGFNITNDGNVPLNITVQPNKNCSEFIGIESGCRFGYWMENSTATGCNGTNQKSLLDFNESVQTNVCSSLKATANADMIEVNIYIKIPELAPSGAKSIDLTFSSAIPG